MANLQLLNNITHKDVTIDIQHSAQHGDNVGGCLVFPAELLPLQREYPIVFQKDPESGLFQLITLFGFSHGENLFLNDKGWDARYIPALMRKEPFLIGFQKDPQNPTQQAPVVHIDMDNPRVGTSASTDTKGLPLFLEAGGVSSFMNDVKKNLLLIHNGLTEAKILVDVLLDNDLLEPLTIDAQFNDQTHVKLTQYYGINSEKLNALPPEKIDALHKKGYLQLMYLVMFSLGNIQHLVTRKNASV